MKDPDTLYAEVAVAGLDRRTATGGTRFFADGVRLHIPSWVQDIDSFRKWTDSEEFPEKGNIWWLRGEVWVDMSKEQIFTHVLLKGGIFQALANLVKLKSLGIMLTDGFLWTNYAGDVSGNPDGAFLSTATYDSDRIRLVEGARERFTELQGTPDMVLEVVSDSSVKKDTEILFEAYWQAGIPEYWLVDARGNQLSFDIFRRGPKGYKHSPKKHGWITSAVFGKSFRLTVKNDKAGRPDCTLEVR